MAFAVYKPVSWTPLDAIRALGASRSKLAYAGRLDPMAEGVLLVLEGDENKNASPYRALDKEYRVRVLFGIGTDSDDALGRIAANTHGVQLDRAALEMAVRANIGTFVQPAPRFSATKVRGRPMYWWARSGREHEVRAPARERTIVSATVTGTGAIRADDLDAMVAPRIRAVRGDFRQKDILDDWARVASERAVYPWAAVRVHCSSGTFMRSLARVLGEALGVPAIALEIVRERVGPYTSATARRIDEASTCGVHDCYGSPMAARFKLACEIVCHDIRYVGRFEDVVERPQPPSEVEAIRLLGPTIAATLDRNGGEGCSYDVRWVTITTLDDRK